MLVQRGTLRVGDAIVAGDAWGKVRALHDYRSERVKDAKPGAPVEILGFDKPPQAGEHARVVENDRQARHLAGLRGQRLRAEAARAAVEAGHIPSRTSSSGSGKVLSRISTYIIKGDVQGSLEAVQSELTEVQHPEVRVNVIHTGIGAISEGDVMLASASSAIVVGFNVRPNAEARMLAERRGRRHQTYRVIYQLTEDIEQALVGVLSPNGRGDDRRGRGAPACFRISRSTASSRGATSPVAPYAGMPRFESFATGR